MHHFLSSYSYGVFYHANICMQVQLRQLDSKVEESNMLISSSHGSQINSQKDIEIDSFLPVSCLVCIRLVGFLISSSLFVL